MRPQASDQFNDSPNRRCENYQIATSNRRNWIRIPFVDCPQSFRVNQNFRPVAADDLSAKSTFPERQPDRPADKPRTDDRDLSDRQEEGSSNYSTAEFLHQKPLRDRSSDRRRNHLQRFHQFRELLGKQ